MNFEHRLRRMWQEKGNKILFPWVLQVAESAIKDFRTLILHK